MDWMTLAVELIGVAILLVFIVIPIQEFKGILTKLRRQGDLEPVGARNTHASGSGDDDGGARA